MESPRAPDQAALASEAATPGASVVAQHGDRHTSALDTPGPPSPGQTSPFRNRSQEERQSASRGHASAGLEAAAAALAPADDENGQSAAAALAPAGDENGQAAVAMAPVPAAPEPLSRPRLRVQGADIILEDAASPKADGVTLDAAHAVASQPRRPAGSATHPAELPAAAAAAAAAAATNHVTQQAQLMISQQHQQGPSQHSLAAAVRAAQSHEHELQLRLASRATTGISNLAHAASTKPKQHADERARGLEGAGPGAEMEHSGSGGVLPDGPVRMKYRSTLTEENVAYLNKVDQYSSRPETSGGERIWRWLDGSGPPFDNPPPSLGVPTVTKAHAAAAGKRQAGKRGFFSCFNCFSGTAAVQ